MRHQLHIYDDIEVDSLKRLKFEVDSAGVRKARGNDVNLAFDEEGILKSPSVSFDHFLRNETCTIHEVRVQ